MLRGIPVSQGVSQGRVIVLHRSHIVPATAGFEIDDQAREEARLQAALAETRKQITAVQNRLRDEVGAKESMIFDAQHMVVADPALLEDVHRKVLDEHLTPEYAFYTASEKYAEALSAICLLYTSPSPRD